MDIILFVDMPIFDIKDIVSPYKNLPTTGNMMLARVNFLLFPQALLMMVP